MSSSAPLTPERNRMDVEWDGRGGFRAYTIARRRHAEVEDEPRHDDSVYAVYIHEIILR